MNVLSLFDGISCGQVALERAGIPVTNYFASEIDHSAISVTQKNHPNTIQIGDITKVTYEDGTLKWSGGEWIGTIDLIIGGSPCQGFSMAGKLLNFDDPRSALFFDFHRLLLEINPKWFILENVRMKKDIALVISNLLGHKEIYINSNLVSAQNRPRLYWTNIPHISQPLDLRCKLSDILESNVSEKYYLSTEAIKKLVFKETKKLDSLTKDSHPKALTERRTDRAIEIRKQCRQEGHDWCDRRDKWLVERDDDKANCLTTAQSKEQLLRYSNGKVRRLTPVEYERLQTIPDNYTQYGMIPDSDELVSISDSKRYHMLGNGWTIDVIVWILGFIHKDL